jgi:hypothetical protein
MKALLLATAAAILLHAQGAQAAPTVIGFDDLPGRVNFANSGINTSYAGFTWGYSFSGFSGAVLGSTIATGWASASTSDRINTETWVPVSGSGYAWTWDGPRSLFIDFGSTRRVLGGWFAAGLGSSSSIAASNTVQMFGYDGTGNVVGTSSILNLSLTEFRELQTNFSGVRFLEIRSDRSGSWFGVDSITIDADAAPVPEPASMALLGAGLLGLAAMRRQRRKRPHAPAEIAQAS